MPARILLTVVYLSALRECSGCLMETVETEQSTARDLYQELDGRYHFNISRKRVRVAVNGELKRWNTSLNTDDIVVFITPVGENKEHD